MERRRREGSHEMIPRREPRQQKSTKRTGHKVVFILGTVLLVGICTVAMLAGLFMMYVRTTLAPTLEVNADDYTMNLSSIIYYQDRDTGDWVEYQTVYGTENRIWVDYEQIPDALWQAAVAIEDHRFFEHNGVDWTRTASATLNFFTGSRATFGGSTLTQQVLKNMTGDDGNTINRKVREIFRALEFEKNYTLATDATASRPRRSSTSARMCRSWIRRNAPASSPSPTTPPCMVPCPPSPSPGRTAAPSRPGS